MFFIFIFREGVYDHIHIYIIIELYEDVYLCIHKSLITQPRNQQSVLSIMSEFQNTVKIQILSNRLNQCQKNKPSPVLLITKILNRVSWFVKFN